MRVGVTRETRPGETRLAATPTTVAQLIKLRYDLVVESGAGASASFADEASADDAGAAIGTAQEALGTDIVFRVSGPAIEEIDQLRDGRTLVRQLSPTLQPGAGRRWPPLAMDAIARISRVHSLDSPARLSSGRDRAVRQKQ